MLCASTNMSPLMGLVNFCCVGSTKISPLTGLVTTGTRGIYKYIAPERGYARLQCALRFGKGGSSEEIRNQTGMSVMGTALTPSGKQQPNGSPREDTGRLTAANRAWPCRHCPRKPNQQPHRQRNRDQTAAPLGADIFVELASNQNSQAPLGAASSSHGQHLHSNLHPRRICSRRQTKSH